MKKFNLDKVLLKVGLSKPKKSEEDTNVPDPEPAKSYAITTAAYFASTSYMNILASAPPYMPGTDYSDAPKQVFGRTTHTAACTKHQRTQERP